MASVRQTPIVLNKTPAPISAASEVIAVRAVLPLNEILVVNDLIEFLVLPADHVPVDAMIEASDLDSDATPALDYSVGLMSGIPGVADTARTVGFELFGTSAGAGHTTGQGKEMARATSPLRPGAIYPAKVDRSIGAKIGTPPDAFSADSTALTMKGMWLPGTAYASADAIYLPDGRRARCSTAGTSGTDFPFVGTEVKAGTVTDGTVTWTIVDAYIALTVWYRASRGGY